MLARRDPCIRRRSTEALRRPIARSLRLDFSFLFLFTPRRPAYRKIGISKLQAHSRGASFAILQRGYRDIFFSVSISPGGAAALRGHHDAWMGEIYAEILDVRPLYRQSDEHRVRCFRHERKTLFALNDVLVRLLGNGGTTRRSVVAYARRRLIHQCVCRKVAKALMGNCGEPNPTLPPSR